MVKYIIIHNTHNGCYDFQCYQDEVARIRLTSITINPPKLFLFNTRDEAQDFFEEYINDVDCIDIKCKKGEDVEHVDYCTCGVIELDETGEPVLFYNKKNQIFLLEHGPQVFIPNQELKNDIKNLNLTNRLIRKCKSLGREQRNRYIELGKYCEECNDDNEDESNDEDSNKKQINIIIEEKKLEKPSIVVIEEKNEIVEYTAKKRVYKNKDTTTNEKQQEGQEKEQVKEVKETKGPEKQVKEQVKGQVKEQVKGQETEKKKKSTTKKAKTPTNDNKIN